MLEEACRHSDTRDDDETSEMEDDEDCEEDCEDEVYDDEDEEDSDDLEGLDFKSTENDIMAMDHRIQRGQLAVRTSNNLMTPDEDATYRSINRENSLSNSYAGPDLIHHIKFCPERRKIIVPLEVSSTFTRNKAHLIRFLRQ